ncbi:MAG: hypothetical protein E6I37_00210 [Chloroflexi bacterium]|nr:MAG: hypothetical protein E6I37_00210 [Chloroflexota bacterium]
MRVERNTTTKNQLVGVLPTHGVVNHALAAGYGAGFQLAFAIALLGFAVAVVVFRSTRILRAAQVVEETAA